MLPFRNLEVLATSEPRLNQCATVAGWRLDAAAPLAVWARHVMQALLEAQCEALFQSYFD